MKYKKEINKYRWKDGNRERKDMLDKTIILFSRLRHNILRLRSITTVVMTNCVMHAKIISSWQHWW